MLLPGLDPGRFCEQRRRKTNCNDHTLSVFYTFAFANSVPDLYTIPDPHPVTYGTHQHCFAISNGIFNSYDNRDTYSHLNTNEHVDFDFNANRNSFCTTDCYEHPDPYSYFYNGAFGYTHTDDNTYAGRD